MHAGLIKYKCVLFRNNHFGKYKTVCLLLRQNRLGGRWCGPHGKPYVDSLTVMLRFDQTYHLEQEWVGGCGWPVFVPGPIMPTSPIVLSARHLWTCGLSFVDIMMCPLCYIEIEIEFWANCEHQPMFLVCAFFNCHISYSILIISRWVNTARWYIR